MNRRVKQENLMLVPPENQTQPLAEALEPATPIQKQTRPVNVEERIIDEEEKNYKEEMEYYLNLKTTNSRTHGLATPEERAAYRKRVSERAVKTEEQLRDRMKNFMSDARPDTRTPDEVLHDYAVAYHALGTYK